MKRGITHLTTTITQPNPLQWRCEVQVQWIDDEGDEHSEHGEIVSEDGWMDCHAWADEFIVETTGITS